MIRILAATLLLGIASPCLACPYSNTTTAIDPPTTVAAQPQQSTPCPTCMTPDATKSAKPAPTSGAPS